MKDWLRLLPISICQRMSERHKKSAYYKYMSLYGFVLVYATLDVSILVREHSSTVRLYFTLIYNNILAGIQQLFYAQYSTQVILCLCLAYIYIYIYVGVCMCVCVFSIYDYRADGYGRSRPKNV